MDMKIKATITRNSNGSVDIRPAADETNTFDIDRIVIYTRGTPSDKDFPVEGEATVTITSGIRQVEGTEVPTITPRSSRKR